MAKQRRIYKGFSFVEDPLKPLVKVAYIDGYDFGDRLLEGVPFKVTVNDKNKLEVGFAEPKGEYEQGLNQKKWSKEALDYVVDGQASFFENADLSGEALQLEEF